MAPATATPLLSHQPRVVPHSPSSSFNVFEGPEKKLQLHFAPFHICNGSHFSTADIQHRANSSERCQKTALENPLLPVPGSSLRSLTRSEIVTILDAAACTILSVMSNEHTDAYLLSESSLFVSDRSLMIKTCGTTRLLRALPVILKLASDRLALKASYVQFSRVSYLFPHAQLFPHDTFEHEVSFLNDHLDAKGQVFVASSPHSSSWHLYCANLDESHQNEISNTNDHEDAMQVLDTQQPSQALEISMFDLDPSTMKRFMFHDRTTMIGKDSSSFGTTTTSGIARLLVGNSIIDAFNFEPCGYSMNALHGNSYYTIHVSPEPDASYVSFETTAPQELLPQLISSVVGLFKPLRFTVALIDNTRAPHASPCLESAMPWYLVSNLLQKQSFRGEKPSIFTDGGGCQATVASFSLCEPCRMVSSPISVLEPSHDCSTIDFNLQMVATSYGAQFIDDHESHLLNDGHLLQTGEETHPHFLVDLGRIASNIQRVSGLANMKRVQMRYAVRCNSDEAILALLSTQDIFFEVTTTAEITLLQNVGVTRDRIVLVTPILSSSMLGWLNAVGIVVLFGEPSHEVLRALKQSDVAVEVCIGSDNLGTLESVLLHVLSVTTSISGIAIDAKHEASHEDKPFDVLLNWLGKVQKSLDLLPSYVRELMIIQVGELLWRDMAPKKVLTTQAMQGRMRTLLSHLPLIGMDVSRLVVGNSVTLIAQVIGRRSRMKVSTEAGKGGTEKTYDYYLNDGVYGSFSNVIMGSGYGTKSLGPEPRTLRRVWGDGSGEKDGVEQQKSDGDGSEHMSTLFGPTCDALDRIWVGKLAVMKVGDRVVFGDMGAYTGSTASGFNGFGREFDTSYIVSRSASGMQ